MRIPEWIFPITVPAKTDSAPIVPHADCVSAIALSIIENNIDKSPVGLWCGHVFGLT